MLSYVPFSRTLTKILSRKVLRESIYYNLFFSRTEESFGESLELVLLIIHGVEDRIDFTSSIKSRRT